MYTKNNIAYPDNPAPEIEVCGIRAYDNHKLWLRFNTGEQKIFDFTPYLDKPVYAPLADIEVFKGVYIDYGVPVWLDGEIDISPEMLYENGVSTDTTNIA